MAKKHVWQVTERGRRGSVVQKRNIPAHSRAEAKEKYESKGYRRFPSTTLTASIIGEMYEWTGNPED